MAFSPLAWSLSVAAVLVCALTAWREGNWRRRDGLELGFVDHGGMWGDLLLLPVANGFIVPHLVPGPWLIVPFGVALITSMWLHARWHGGRHSGIREHMWPSRPYGVWYRDLSLAGWLHVAYVVGEFGLILASVLAPAPGTAILAVTAILTLHVPLGLLQPGWRATGTLPRHAFPLLASALLLLWASTAARLALSHAPDPLQWW